MSFRFNHEFITFHVGDCSVPTLFRTVLELILASEIIEQSSTNQVKLEVSGGSLPMKNTRRRIAPRKGMTHDRENRSSSNSNLDRTAKTDMHRLPPSAMLRFLRSQGQILGMNALTLRRKSVTHGLLIEGSQGLDLLGTPFAKRRSRNTSGAGFLKNSQEVTALPLGEACSWDAMYRGEPVLSRILQIRSGDYRELAAGVTCACCQRRYFSRGRARAFGCITTTAHAHGDEAG